MVRVLFVCLGNICRSPMAEAVFRKLVQQENLKAQFHIDSAGTGDWHIGDPPHEGTRNILNDFDVEHKGLKARQVNLKDMDAFDYIIAMDAANIGELHRLAGNTKSSHIARLLDFVKECPEDDVPDPYFTGNFDEVYELVIQGCKNLLQHIKTKEFIQ